MRKVTFVLLWLCITSFASATTVMFVNDGDVTDGEQVLIDIMTSQGYEVTIAEDLGPNHFQTLDEAKIAALSTVDLIFVSHRMAMNNYDEGDEAAQWNALTPPILLLRTRATGNNRWDWLAVPNNARIDEVIELEAVIPDHPVFSGVSLDENNRVLTDNVATCLMETTDPGNGTVIAKDATNGYAWIVAWDAGQPYYAGSAHTAAGPRMLFSLPNNDPHDLTPDGLLMISNAVYFMSGATFDRAPMVTTGPDGVIYIGSTFQLTGTAYDPEGSVTTTWSLLSGPGNPNISDTAITDPTLTPDAPGTYVLQMSADDGVNPPVSNTTTLYVKDHANDILLAHWTFDEVVDGNSIPDVTGNGFTAEIWPNPSEDPELPTRIGEPNFVEGHIDASIQAVDLTWQEYGFTIPEPYRESDPNFNVLDLGMTVAAWIQIPADTTDGAGRIIAGSNWSIQAVNGGVNVRWTVAGLNQVSHPVNDGYWHHYVGTFDPVTGLQKLYIDGFQIAEDPVDGPLPENLVGVAIGASPGGSGPASAMIDDIQVYSYALTDADVDALAIQGDRILHVDLGPDIEFLRGADPLLLEPTVIDDGAPEATYTWEKVSSSPDPDATVTFTPAGTATEIDFSKGGAFVLRLTADDGIVPASDDITVTVINPTCQTALDDGLVLPGDIAGPEGAGFPDCRVDFHDLAVIASSWVLCNDPEDETCQWPWQ